MVNNFDRLHLPYEDRLDKLALCSFNYRHPHDDLIKTYELFIGCECALEFDKFFELARTDHLRGRLLKLHGECAHIEARRNAFHQRVIGTWNGLPDEVVFLEPVATFKCKLSFAEKLLYMQRTLC
ncbi:unnamed protein product [Dibothriocephalus latus]|uniref:Uncharacterized protein n=1 Tax=Dibothriocephalus latus TaxID=60516 RepID=A0A3P6T6J4_DIBLA|nr:unnamed protein product [Dibothriocephalus latus]